LLGAGRLVVGGIVRAASKVIDQVDHDVGSASLPSEKEIVVCQVMSVEIETEFHKSMGY
jgi:hypothetical protein